MASRDSTHCLTAVSATGAGSVIHDSDACTGTATLVVVSGTGVTAGAVTLQGSLDNTNWFNASAALTAPAAGASAAQPATAGVVARYWRANVTTTVTGGTVDAWVATA